MKVGILTDGLYPYDHGGHQIRMHNLACRFAEQHDVDVYVQEKPGVSYPADHHGVNVRTVPSPVKSDRLRLTLGGLSYAKRVVDAVKAAETTYDVVDVSFSAETSRLSIPTVASYGAFLQRWHEISGAREKVKNAIPAVIQYYLNRRTLAGADHVVALSDRSRDELERLFAPTCPATTIKNGVDAEHFTPEGATASLPDLGENLGLYAGRLHDEKGVFELVEAVATADVDIGLVFVGYGPAEQGLRELARDRGLEDRVTFAGFVDYERMPAYYRAADVCILPSYFEIQPLTCLEAMACGTPVVASDIAGVRELVTHEETGLLVRPADSSGLARAIEHVLATDSLRSTLSRNGLAFAKTRTWEAIAAETLAVYRSLVDR